MTTEAKFVLALATPVSQEIRRIVLEKITVAAEQLGNRDLPISKRIHETRKRIKEIRATLRLGRKALGRKFVLENRWFRDTARVLAPARDAAATLEAFTKFGSFLQLEAGRSATRSLGRLLRKRASIAAPSAEELDAAVDEVQARLAIAHRRVSEWGLDADRSDVVQSLRTTYGKARNQLRALRPQSSDVAIHEWRKRVKDHWYHILMLREVCPTLAGNRSKDLDVLSHLLGDHHDLSVVHQAIEEQVTEFRGDVVVSRLRAAITLRQEQLEREARDLGRSLFAMKPAIFSKAVADEWEFELEEASIEAEASRLRRSA